MKKFLRYVKRVYPGILLASVLLIAWQFIVDFGIVKRFMLPSPTDIFAAFVKNFQVLLMHSGASLTIVGIGLFLSILLAFVLAVVMELYKPVNSAVYPLMVISQAIPQTAITLIVVLILGFGNLPKIAVIVLVCFFPLCISMVEGFKAADRDVLRLMRVMGASKLQMLWHVKLPTAIPGIFSGLKIIATYSINAAVIAELLGAYSGLGYYMMQMKRRYAYDKMFAAVLMVVLLSILVFKAVEAAHKKVLALTGEQKGKG